MGQGVVIDANMIAKFCKKHFNDEKEEIVDTVLSIADRCHIAISDLIEHEWLNCYGNQAFKEWLTDEMKTGRIIYITPEKIPTEMQKSICQMGFPFNTRDKEYIRVALATTTKFILTEDIHFYEPKAKDQPHANKERFRVERKGTVCRFLERKMGIRVGLCCHCREFLPCLGS